jgi:MSHA biogenesis protein MshO
MRRRAETVPAGQQGFTLVEAVVVIVITGILAGVVAVFITRPVEGYVDTARRAELTDEADTALRRIARDLHLALPNSVRVDATGRMLEYIPAGAGGRYQSEGAGALDFTQAVSSFNVVGTAAAPITAQAGDWIVVYNLGPGIDRADAYVGFNRAAVRNSVNCNAANCTVPIAATQFPFESPSQRFQVVQQPVSYVCSPTGAGGDGGLRRYTGYGFSAGQPASFTVSGPLLAQNVNACSIAYTPGVTERSGLVVMSLTLTTGGESVSLVHQVQVANVP